MLNQEGSAEYQWPVFYSGLPGRRPRFEINKSQFDFLRSKHSSPGPATGCRAVCSVVCIEFYFVYCCTYWRARDTAECVASYCGRATMSAWQLFTLIKLHFYIGSRADREQTPLPPVGQDCKVARGVRATETRASLAVGTEAWIHSHTN